MSLAADLARAHRTLDVAMDSALKSHGLAVEHWRALDAIVREPALAMTDLAKAAALNLPTLSKLIDRLAERGLVRRQRHAEDTRRVIIFPTPQGTHLAEAARASVEAAEATLAKRLGQWDMDRLKRLLQALA